MPGRLGAARFSEDELSALFAPLSGFRRLGLAVSGGPDSLGLMLAVVRWARDKDRPTLVVYTVDHGLRPEAAHEAAMVAREASALGLAVRVLTWDGAKPATGLQAAARRARYRLIGAAMDSDGVEALVTAHHLEDQAETVLMRLAHGSGIGGLAGMEADTIVEGVRVIRPLLLTPRARLLAEVEAARLTPADDPGNRDTDYERVRWRQALPDLGALGLSPERLALFARRAAEADAALEVAAAEATARFGVDMSDTSIPADNISLPHGGVTLLPKSVAVRVLSQLIARVGRAVPELAQVEGLHAALTAPVPFAGRTLAGAIIRRSGSRIRIRAEALTGARARRAGALTPQPADAGQPGARPPQIAEIASARGDTGLAPPLYRSGAGPTFAEPSRRPAAGIPGQD